MYRSENKYSREITSYLLNLLKTLAAASIVSVIFFFYRNININVSRVDFRGAFQNDADEKIKTQSAELCTLDKFYIFLSGSANEVLIYYASQFSKAIGDAERLRNPRFSEMGNGFSVTIVKTVRTLDRQNDKKVIYIPPPPLFYDHEWNPSLRQAIIELCVRDKSKFK